MTSPLPTQVRFPARPFLMTVTRKSEQLTLAVHLCLIIDRIDWVEMVLQYGNFELLLADAKARVTH